MKVYQVKLKLFMINNIELKDIQSKVCSFIDTGLVKYNRDLYELHESNTYKNYCFDAPYPIEEDKIYRGNKVYTLTIRTINVDLAEFFSNKLVNEYSKDIKALTSEIKILPQKHIEKIYSITTTILKEDYGYWRDKTNVSEFEKRVKENLIKKYNMFTKTKIDEDFQLYTTIEFKNRKPISSNYKNIKLLGDKISLNIAENDNAQKLAYMSLGTGILEMNSRGYGFVNYRWL